MTGTTMTVETETDSPTDRTDGPTDRQSPKARKAQRKATPDLFSDDLNTAIRALGSCRGSPDAKHAVSLYKRVSPFRTRPLPVGVTVQMLRFLIVTAGTGMWAALDKRDNRLAELISCYYTSEHQMVDFADKEGFVGVRSVSRISQLISEALNILWKTLPDAPTLSFPLDKTQVFVSIDNLRRGRKRISALKQQEWNNPANKAQLAATLREARQKEEAREKMHMRAQKRSETPQERARLRHISAQGVAARRRAAKAKQTSDTSETQQEALAR